MNRATERLSTARLDHDRGQTLRWSVWVALCTIVAGCASTAPSGPEASDPTQDPVPAPNVVLPAEPTAYELRQRERADALARQGRLAEAALAWEVLATIRPNVPEYRERLAELNKQIGSGVAERMQRGEQAIARGQVDAAMQQFLAALALQPDNTRAADALRAAERERIKRNHLGKLSRNTLTRRAMSEADMGANETPMDAVAQAEPGATAKAGAAGPGRNELEHAALLASQGEWDEVIRLLEQRLRANRQDTAARELLADAYFQKAEATAGSNRGAAIALLERSVRNDPRHPRAPARLRELRLAATAASLAAGGAARPTGSMTAGAAVGTPGAGLPTVPQAAAPAPVAGTVPRMTAAAPTALPAAVKPTTANMPAAAASTSPAAPRR